MTGSFAEGGVDAVVRAVASGEISYQTGTEAELPPVPDAEPKVVCSLRLPVDVYQRLRDVADDRGVKPTVLMRDWVVAGLAGADAEAAADRYISVADLLRAVAALPDRHAA